MIVYEVRAQGLVVRFPCDVRIYQYGRNGVDWPAYESDQGEFQRDQARQGNWGWDMEGRCIRGVWRRYKQAQDGGKVELVNLGQEKADCPQYWASQRGSEA